MKRVAMAALVLLQCGSALAQAPRSSAEPAAADDPLTWIDSAYRAARLLNFEGVFVWRDGRGNAETSRISRMVDASGVQERIDVIDGPSRELVRFNDELRCYLPQSATVRIERGVGDRPLLGTLPTDPAAIQAHYQVRKGPVDRVAGMECQILTLEPRDALRHGHRVCAELGTRMILKGQTLDAAGQPVETFSFTQITIGGSIPRDRLQSRFAERARGWRVEETPPVADAVSGWTVRGLPEGFRKLAEYRRRVGTSGDVSQMVFSDGLAAVSVFIEAARADGPASTPEGLSRRGATSIFVRRAGDHLITVVGDAPAECVQTIAHGVTPRGGQ